MTPEQFINRLKDNALTARGGAQAHFPMRPVSKPGHEMHLMKRTLPNLYKMRPAWLVLAHKELDVTVAEAYGWQDYTPDMQDEEVLRRLLEINLMRAKG